MIRIAGRALYQRPPRQYSAYVVKEINPSISPLGNDERALTTSNKGTESRFVEISTKDQYIDFPRDKCVLYFTARWCPPCRRIGPVVAELSGTTPGVKFGKIDIDDNPDATKMADVRSVPVFKFYKGGLEVDSISGGDATALEQKLAELAESP